MVCYKSALPLGHVTIPTYRVCSQYFATSARTFITFFDVALPFCNTDERQSELSHTHTNTYEHTNSRIQTGTYSHRHTGRNTHQRNLIVFGGRNIRLLIEKLAKSQVLKRALIRGRAEGRERSREREKSAGRSQVCGMKTLRKQSFIRVSYQLLCVCVCVSMVRLRVRPFAHFKRISTSCGAVLFVERGRFAI